LISKAKKSHNH